MNNSEQINYILRISYLFMVDIYYNDLQNGKLLIIISLNNLRNINA